MIDGAPLLEGEHDFTAFQQLMTAIRFAGPGCGQSSGLLFEGRIRFTVFRYWLRVLEAHGPEHCWSV